MISETLVDLANRLAGLLLLVLALPALVVIGFLVRVTSAGPAIYSQTRVGQFGRSFRIYKFRTMHQDADALLAGLLGGTISPFFKIRNDPRVTTIGRVLRLTSLDELPQLVNVVRGEMNLVGPRPQSPAEVAAYGGVAWRRLLVKPGITGMWQVSGRSDLQAHEGLELDLAYVRDWTPALDLRVLARTPRAVLTRKGAY